MLWYIQDRFKPKFMVNLATLTGAILGGAWQGTCAALFSNNDELSTHLSEAGNATGEKVWRMPLTAEYDKLIDHDVADMKNTSGRNAGSITAAQFLQRFVNNVPWAAIPHVAVVAMDSHQVAHQPELGLRLGRAPAQLPGGGALREVVHSARGGRALVEEN